MRRYREPAVVAFALALIASLMVHLPVYDALGRFADQLKALAAEKKAAERDEVVELNFEVSDDTDDDRPAKKERKRPKRRKIKQLAKKQLAELEKELKKKAEEQPKRNDLTPQTVQQRSQDPDVEAPEDAKFLAEQNSRVEEETSAAIRNYVRDDPNPASGKQQEFTQARELPGNADEQDIQDLRELEGSEARTVTPEEARRRRPKHAPDVDPLKSTRIARDSKSGKRAKEPGLQPSTESELLTIVGPNGTFRIRAPRKTTRGGGRRDKGKGPSLVPSWSQYEAAVGSDQLKQARNARIRERKSRQRGMARSVRWEQFRAAIENFTPDVKPGTQTALNAAASPFANYISAIHRKIHRQFADRYLPGLPTFAASPFSDPGLRTELEIVLNRDGSVERIGVAKTSGLLPFDFGAYNSVLAGQPYPEPPPDILSGDGRVYLHWGFYRNHRQCGTFNAKPYVIPNPRGMPRRKPGLQDGLHFDQVVPDDVAPTWGTDSEKG